jgi:hypothetical protein
MRNPDFRTVRVTVACGFTFAVAALFPPVLDAQGCILTRNMAPVLGAQLSPYLQQGEWQLGASYRQFTADHQYQGSELSPAVTALGTQVISKMRYMELSGTYAVTSQWNVAVGVPLILDASSNRALPANVAGSPRYVHSSAGIGDIIVTGRHWFMNCEQNPHQNFSLGVGVKMPTGEGQATDMFPNALGQDVRERPVDQSIQLGDTGWGLSVTFEGFKQFGFVTTFASGVYQFNPKDQNDTLSPPALLNPVGPQAVDERQRFNTVSDSYLARFGVGVPVPRVTGTSLSLAARLEGVPVHDAFGETAGFRRPGFYLTMEPGVIFSKGRGTVSFGVPIRVHQNVKRSLGFVRDSTFADFMMLGAATFRFGGLY